MNYNKVYIMNKQDNEEIKSGKELRKNIRKKLEKVDKEEYKNTRDLENVLRYAIRDSLEMGLDDTQIPLSQIIAWEMYPNFSKNELEKIKEKIIEFLNNKIPLNTKTVTSINIREGPDYIETGVKENDTIYLISPEKEISKGDKIVINNRLDKVIGIIEK
ncbi:MAG: hypothetical protein ACOCP8_02145 [archaeon]